MSHDAAINAFTVKSAGTKSVTASRSHGSAFIIPVITPVTMPVGPYKLSIQPGSGSLAVAITINYGLLKKDIIFLTFFFFHGISCFYCWGAGTTEALTDQIYIWVWAISYNFYVEYRRKPRNNRIEERRSGIVNSMENRFKTSANGFNGFSLILYRLKIIPYYGQLRDRIVPLIYCLGLFLRYLCTSSSSIRLTKKTLR